MKIVEFKDYDNQTTPLSAYNLNRLQQNLITTKYQMTFSSAVSGGSTITLPCYYQVGQDTLDVYLNSELLKKASTKDSEGHYYEVGNSDTKSNQIKITSDWSIASGDVLNLIVRGTTDSYDQNLSPDKATQLADEISANKEEITALQTENSRLKGITNALPKISGEDTSLTLTNTANAPFSKLILKGNTKQQQYSGKNLFDKSKALTGYWIIDEQGNIGRAENIIFVTDFIPVFKDVPVYIPATGTARREFYNKNKVGTTYLNNSRAQVFTPTEDGFIRVTCNMDTITMDSLMIYYGTTETEYEPYVGGTASPNPDYPQEIHCVKGNNVVKISNGTEETEYKLNLGNIELNAIEDFKDYFKKEKNKWYKVENIGSYTFEGNENFSFKDVGTSNQRFDILISALNITTQNNLEYKLFTHFKQIPNNNGVWGEYYMSSNWLVIKDNDNIITSLEDFKSWLSANKPTIYYARISPIDIEITDTTLITQLDALEQAVSYDDTTNITQTNANLPFYINAEAFKKIS